MIFIGAENIISPLGNTAKENFEKARQGISGITDSVQFPIATIHAYQSRPGHSKLETLILSSIEDALEQLDMDATHGKWLLILSTTKGDVDHLKSGDVAAARTERLIKKVVENLPFSMETLVVSNACISGVSAAILAHDYLEAARFDHIIVVGADLASEFTYKGFESFFALSQGPCKPFDKNRSGLSLGEAVSTVILSKDRTMFREVPCEFRGGATSNDANHISGPSRNGEGLYRAIRKCLKIANDEAKDIDFISAHGTATLYNDDMESIAFNRCGLAEKPLNSFKGYFGHTLGAAGVLEISMCLQSIRNKLLLSSLGFEMEGTSEKLNVLSKNESVSVGTVLKTASGFGGCNAACIIKKVDTSI